MQTPEQLAAEIGPELAGAFFELFAAGYIAAILESAPQANRDALLMHAGEAYRRTIAQTTHMQTWRT